MNKSPLFDLHNTTAVVAGCSGLIGKAVLNVLRDCGADILGFDINVDRQSDLICLDISKAQDLEKFFADLSSKPNQDKRNWAFVNVTYPRTKNWGSLDFENVDSDEWNENMKLHLGSAFTFTQKAVEFLRGRNGGAIINFASIYGLGGPDLSIYEGTEMKNSVAYSAIKSGIIGFTRYVATAFGKHNIRANIVAPGGVGSGTQPHSFVRAYEKRTPLGRMATPEDISGVVAFLASPAARYITGQVIAVDGGWTAW